MGQIWENKVLCGPNYYIQSVGIIIYRQSDTVSGPIESPSRRTRPAGRMLPTPVLERWSQCFSVAIIFLVTVVSHMVKRPPSPNGKFSGTSLITTTMILPICEADEIPMIQSLQQYHERFYTIANDAKTWRRKRAISQAYPQLRLKHIEAKANISDFSLTSEAVFGEKALTFHTVKTD